MPDFDAIVWEWIVFSVLVVILLTLDLLVFHRHDHAPSLRESAWWTVFWVGVGLTFNAVFWWWKGHEEGVAFLSAFLIEKSLSMDNIFVFVVIFRFFAVPLMYQYRVLFWGILGAVFMRLAFILAGVELMHRFDWVIPLFGAFLVYTAYKLVRHSGTEIHPEKNPALLLARRFFRITHGDHAQYGHAFFVREAGKLCITPMFLTLLVIESSDVIFAVDSVPAVIGIITSGTTTFTPSQTMFIAFSSNVFAILGLRALYFLLAGMVDRFRYLHYGLAAVLGFVGLKMLAQYWFEFELPRWAPLLVIAVLLAISVVVSLLIKPSDDQGTPAEE